MLSRTQEITANNLANINTPGFKKDKLFYNAFQEQLHGQTLNAPQIEQFLNLEPGTVEPTGNPFDFAIEGDGFFEIEYEGETFLSRNGRFHIDAEGNLKDENGGFVQGVGGPINIPEFTRSGAQESEQPKMEVAKDGTVRLNDLVVGQIKLVKVDDLQGLERRTNSYLAIRPGTSTQDDTESLISQGYYESGNVNPLQEMISMTTNTRLFESQQRNMRTTDELLSRVTGRLSRF